MFLSQQPPNVGFQSLFLGHWTANVAALGRLCAFCVCAFYASWYLRPLSLMRWIANSWRSGCMNGMRHWNQSHLTIRSSCPQRIGQDGCWTCPRHWLLKVQSKWFGLIHLNFNVYISTTSVGAMVQSCKCQTGSFVTNWFIWQSFFFGHATYMSFLVMQTTTAHSACHGTWP